MYRTISDLILCLVCSELLNYYVYFLVISRIRKVTVTYGY